MNHTYTIGLDIGTTSICGVLYRIAEGTVVASGEEKNEFLRGERYEQDPGRILSAVEQILDGLWTEGIAGVGISSQMHGILYVDGAGEAVSPYFTWKDTRGTDPEEGGLPFARLLSEKTGYSLNSGYGTVTHAWMQWKGCVPGKAVKMANIGDYVGMRLTGRREPVASPAIAASFGGFDVEQGHFAKDVLSGAGIDCSYYPVVVPQHTILGMYRGVPVYCACGDNQASFLSASGDRGDCVAVNVGTGSQVAVRGARWNPVKDVDIRPYPGGGYLYVGASLNGGKVYELLARFFLEICGEFTGTWLELADVYRRMELLADRKLSTSLNVMPNLYGSRSGYGEKSGKIPGGAIWEICEANFRGEDLIRGYVRGMAAELYELFQKMPADLRAGKRRIVASGNGIRKNRLLREEIEKSFGMKVEFSPYEEEAAAGAAMLACVSSVRDRGM